MVSTSDISSNSPCLPCSFQSANTRLWLREEVFWLDLVFKTDSVAHRKFIEIKSDMERLGAKCLQLLTTLAKKDSTCFRISSSFSALEKCFAPFYDEFPKLLPYVMKQISKSN